VRKVLLTTDFSENANEAIEYALMLFDNESVEYYLLNSYSLLHNIPETLISLEDILQEQSKKGLSKALSQITRAHQKLKIETLSVYGDPSFVIKQIANDRQVDLVVVGSRGWTLNGALFGSTAVQLVKSINRPMLVVPHHYKPNFPKNIVVATDLIQIEDLKVLNTMLAIARRFQAKITILNVTGGEEHDQANQALQLLNFNDHFEGIKSRFEVVDNKDIVAGLAEYADKYQADLLVLSPKRYHNFRSMFHNSITKSVIKHSHIPVMVV